MGKKLKGKKKKLLKENARTQIYDKLRQSLGEFEDGHPKKFENALQKASKLFVPLALKKQPTVEEKP